VSVIGSVLHEGESRALIAVEPAYSNAGLFPLALDC